MKRKCLKCAAFLFVLMTVIFTANRCLFSEGRYFDGYEENYLQTYQGFKKLPENSLDIVICGSSNVFMDISPLDLWSEYGYKAYNLATPMQTLEESYFQLYKSFETQSPQLVLLDCLAFEKYDDNGEAYTHMAYDAYPWSIFKNTYLNENLPSSYDLKSFMVPFLIYHSRYDEMCISDFDVFFYTEKEDFLGYSPAFSVVPSEKYGLERGHEEASFDEKDRIWLEKILSLCEENGCELILIKSPCVGSWWKEDSEIMTEIGEKYGVQYWDLSEEASIDKELDFCDGGGHLNDRGARKLTRIIGEKILNYAEDFERFNTNKVVSEYFDSRFYNLEKCRKAQALKYDKDVFEICEKLMDDDYVLCINVVVTPETNNILGVLTDNAVDSQPLNQRVSLILDRKENLLEMVTGDDNIVMEKKWSDTWFYLENKSTGSMIQADYHNYALSCETGISIVVWDKYYECVIDEIDIVETDGNIEVTHCGI